MAQVNRYTTPREGMVIAPLSLEDYTRAGSIKAETTGELSKFANTQDLSYDVLAEDYQKVEGLVQPLEEGIGAISEAVISGDISTSVIDTAREIKRAKNNLFGEHGAVTKAQQNKLTKDQWQLDVQKYAIENGLTSKDMQTILRKGNENFGGTFNDDNSFNTFQPEFGPGYVQIPEYLRSIYDQVKGNMTEQTIKALGDNEIEIVDSPKHGGFMVINKEDGNVSTNHPQLQAALDAINLEIDSEDTELGSHINYFGLNPSDVKNQAADIMNSFIRSERTNPKYRGQFVRTQALSANTGDNPTPQGASFIKDNVKRREGAHMGESEFTANSKDNQNFPISAILDATKSDDIETGGEANRAIGTAILSSGAVNGANILMAANYLMKGIFEDEKVPLGENIDETELKVVNDGSGAGAVGSVGAGVVVESHPTVYKSASDVIANEALQEVSNPYVNSYLDNATAYNVDGSVKQEYPSVSQDDLTYNLKTTAGDTIQMPSIPKIAEQFNVVKEASTRERSMEFQPLVDVTGTDKLFMTKKNENSVSSQKAQATPKTEWSETKGDLLTQQGNGRKVYNNKGEEISWEDFEKVIQKSTSESALKGDLQGDPRQMINPETGKPEIERVNASLYLITTGTGDDKTTEKFYVSQTEQDMNNYYGPHTANVYERFVELANADPIYGTEMVINASAIPELGYTELTYADARIAPATEAEEKISPSGYMVLIPEYNAKGEFKSVKRIPAPYSAIRDKNVLAIPKSLRHNTLNISTIIGNAKVID